VRDSGHSCVPSFEVGKANLGLRLNCPMQLSFRLSLILFLASSRIWKRLLNFSGAGKQPSLKPRV
jgi:hypothetical protein